MLRPALCLIVATCASAQPPQAILDWKAEGPVKSYSTETVYDYMDGGAEVYLAYGMKQLRAVKYLHATEPAINLSIFEMDDAAGAFGIFTYERLDEEAGVGQGSEYAAGMLRYWQGRHFVFIQAEQETPASRKAVLELGKVLLPQLGPSVARPALPEALPAQGLRPLTVRYAKSPLILKNLETTLADNPLGLPERTAAAVGRYGKAGNPERVLIARFPYEAAARKGVEAYRKSRGAGTAEPFQGPAGWSLAASAGNHAVLVLDSPDAAGARARLQEATRLLKEVLR